MHSTRYFTLLTWLILSFVSLGHAQDAASQPPGKAQAKQAGSPPETPDQQRSPSDVLPNTPVESGDKEGKPNDPAKATPLPWLQVDGGTMVTPTEVALGSMCSSCTACNPCATGCGRCSKCCGGGGAGSHRLFPDGMLGGSLNNFGGEFRFRYHDERGMFGGRFSPATYNTLLTRLRAWGDLQLTEDVYFRGEMFFADSSTNDGFRPIDRNRGDVRNMFLHVGLTDDVAVRVGRQDFLYGAQRVISPLDWGNTRRAFDGVKLVYTGLEDWQWDGFYGNLVNVLVDDFDRTNYDVSLYGAYGAYKGFDKMQVEPYYIGYDNQTFGFSRHMFGARVNGKRADGWLYEVEAAHQFGKDLGDNVSEGFFTVGAGRDVNVASSWKPRVWFYFDYATGDAGNNRAANVGYDEVFPLTHKYLGFIDTVLRSNVIAPNVLLTMSPTERLSFLMWYYHFRAENDGAVVPGVGNAPQVVGAGRKHLGDELDLLATLRINPRNSLLVGYSHFWRGSRVAGTNDADFFYLQHTFRY